LHSIIAAGTGFAAGQLYDGTLIPTTSIMLVCAFVGLLGIPLARGALAGDANPTDAK
jgi:hypothetical protein